MRSLNIHEGVLDFSFEFWGGIGQNWGIFFSCSQCVPHHVPIKFPNGSSSSSSKISQWGGWAKTTSQNHLKNTRIGDNN